MDPSQLPPAQPATNYTRPDDPSQYIRTYAKDVAQLTNAPAPNAPQPLRTGSVPTFAGGSDAPTLIHEEGVTLTDFDSSPVNRKGDAASPKEFAQEVVELSQDDSEGIFAGSTPAPSPAPAPLMPQSAIGIVPNSVASAAPASSGDPEREAILARLRAKVEASRASEPPAPAYVLPPQEEPVRPPTPEPILPVAPAEPEPLLRTAAPDFTSIPAPSVPSPRDTFRLPDLKPQATAPAGPSPLHTYSGDFATRIDEQGSSRFSVLAAQSDAQPRPASEISQPRRRTFVPLMVGAAMLVVGMGAVIGAYVFLKSAPPTPTLANVPSLIAYDESVRLEGSGTSLLQAWSNAAQGTAVSGNVVVTYVTGQEASSTAVIPQPGGVFVRRLSLPAPDILLRNIDDSSTVGYIKAGSESRPFFILRVNSYERTFAGMLAWEQTLPNDLSVLYPPYATQQSASTTSTLIVLPTSGPAFVDAVVANHDLRVLRDASGRSIMLYGYVAKDTLIIARDEAAFTALAGRLSAAAQ